MAISTLNEPNEFTPIFHSSLFRLDSTLKTNLNFKYVFKIFISAVEVLKVKVSPEPTNGYGLFEARPHLQDFLDQDIFDITDAAFQEAPRVEYVMKIDEEYTDGAGNLVTNSDVKVFSNKIGFNTLLTRNEFFGDLTKLQVDTATPGEMLINIEELTQVFQDDLFFVHFAGDTTAPFQPIRFEILELSQSGAPTAAATIITGSSGSASQLVTMDFGAISFNAATKFVRFRLIDLDSNPEAQYLHQLAQGLNLSPDTVNQVHKQLGAPLLYS